MPLDLQISHHVRRKTEVELLKIRVQWAKYLSIWLNDPAFSSFMDESRVELWLGFLSTYAHRYVGTPLRKLLDGYLIWSQTLSEKPDYWNRLCKLEQFFFMWWVKISFSSVCAWIGFIHKHVCYSLSRVRLFETPWTVAYEAPLSMESSRQEYWTGSPFPSPEGLPDPRIKLRSLALQADSLPSEPPREAHP